MAQDFSLSQLKSGDGQALANALALIAQGNRQTPAQLRQVLANQVIELSLRDLDPGLQPLLPPLQQLLATWLQGDDSAYLDARHSLRVQFDVLYRHLSRWYLRDTKPSQQFYERLAQATANQQALGDFCRWADKEAERADMLARRLGESETGHLRLAGIEAKVVELLNEHLAQRSLPSELAQWLPSLKSELQHSLTTADGDQAPLWRQWLRLLPHLGKAFQNPDDQWLYSQIPALTGELERSLQLPQSNPVAYQAWVEQLNQSLMLIIQKKPQETQLLEPLAYPDGYRPTGARISQSLLQQSQALQPGDWLLFDGEQGQVRARLACKITEADQLLFVDQAGRKLMSHNLKDMALCLTTGIAQPLPEPRLHLVMHSLLTKLAAQAQQLQERQQEQAKEDALAQAKEAAERQQLQSEAAARAMQEQLEQRRAAARKAMAEARALAEQDAQRQEILKQQTAKQESPRQEPSKAMQPQQAARTAAPAASAAVTEAARDKTVTNNLASPNNNADSFDLDNLRVGAWLNLELTPGEPARAKLSVILAGVGKYIFVDQLGRKLAELQRAQLIELIQQNRAQLLKQGGDFEDQLAKVIRGLRKDTSL